MRVIRFYISMILFWVMAFAVTPKEFIHMLYHHKDTVEDEYCLKGILNVEPLHHHCEMLTYVAFPFVNAGSVIAIQDMPVVAPPMVVRSTDMVSLCRFNVSRFRAPPVA